MLQRQRLLLVGRLQRLQRLGLADETQPGTWAVHADAEKTLRALGERGDIIRTMQRAMRGEPRELAAFEPSDNGRTILGRVAAKGLADELRSEEHTSEIQSIMRNSYAVCRLKKKQTQQQKKDKHKKKE